VTKCVACGAALASETRFCPECGAPLAQPGDDTETRLAPQASGAVTTSRPSSRSSSGSQSGWLSTSAVVDEGRFLPGAILAGRYRMIGPIGKGGMGEVYRADDLRLGQSVALKFLPESVAHDAARLAQFHQEVRSARQVAHPNVCRVYDIGEVDGLTFLSMEYVSGEDLASLAKRIGRLSPDKALDLSRQLCAGLAAAHDRRVLHRDLKPANLMLDDNGQLRITDFGLAGLVGDVGPRAGTPAYMAPEQLAGQPATVQSDIYALGLVMYELFTGQRPFDFRSIAELMQRHDEGIPPPSSFVTGLDLSVDRGIMRCLERDPAKRPDSARKVLASLPGGDPLAAALAAGETPSPEMVAAAGETSAIRPARGLAAVALVLVGIAITVSLFDRILLANRVPMDRSPAVLADRAQDIIRRVGYTEPAADSATGLIVWMDPLRWIDRTDRAPDRWERLRSGSPPGILFWYRESPQPLVPITRNRLVSFNDPPATSAGMLAVILDPRGRLVEFQAVPTRRDETAPALVTPELDALFQAAGLDRARFTPAEPGVTPRAYADSRMAWDGTLSDESSTKVCLEAATYRGRPVQFQVIAPWTQLAAGQRALAPGRGERVLGVMAALVIPTFLIVGVVIARRNLRAGRGDRRGAAVAAVFVLATTLAAWALAATHASQIDTEIDRLFNVALPAALFSAANLWIWYIALEPYVRRFWPDALLGWSRLVAGHFRDARIGLEVLAGAVCGTIMTLLVAAHDLVPALVGAAPPMPLVTRLTELLGTRYFLASLLETSQEALTNGMIGVFGLVFFRIIFKRRPWVAFWAAMVVFTPVALRGMFPGDPGLLELSFAVAILATVVLTLMRFGLLAGTVGLFCHFILAQTTLTWHWERWYSAPTIGMLTVAAGLALFGYYAARGQEPLFSHVFD
jgi:serine/threonine-protein kinase